MNVKHAIAGTTIIIGAALGAGALSQTPAVVGAFVPGPATILAPAGANPFPIAPEAVQLLSGETTEFDGQVYTADDAPQVTGLDPGIYFVPVWGADTDTRVLYV
jgi:hypothetical protein